MTPEEYIKAYTRGCSNELVYGGYHEWLTPENALAAVELARNKLKEPTSDDLEEAANQIVNKAIPPLAQKYKDGTYVGCIRDCFDRKEFIDLVKAGAKWQREQMMKDAVEGSMELNHIVVSYAELTKSFPEGKDGDNVKVIIIKE